MSLLRWGKGGDFDHVTGLNWDTRLVGYRKIPAWQWAKLPRYWREGAVEVRPFPAEKRLRASEAQGLSGEAVKGNPTATVILRVDESKSSPRATEDLTEPLLGLKPVTLVLVLVVVIVASAIGPIRTFRKFFSPDSNLLFG
jgi:hypothetical protein